MSGFIFSRVSLTALITAISLAVFQTVVERFYPGTSPWQADAATVLFATLMTTVASYLSLRQYEILQARTVEEREARLRTELALHQSDELFRLLVETMSEGLAIRDKAGRHTFVNRHYCEMLGFTEGELLGETVDILVENDNKAIAALEWTKRLRGEAEPFELTLTRKDGGQVHTQISPRIIQDEQGEFLGSFGVITDITAQKKREAELIETKSLLEKTFASLKEAVLVVEPETRTILTCNAAVTDIFGYTPDELIGQPTLRLHLDRDSYTRFAQEGDSALASSEKFQTEYLMRHKDGRVIHTEHTVTPLSSEDGASAGVVSVVRDITTRKQAEDALRRSEENNRTLIETMAQGVIYLDKAGRITAANPAAERILGVPLSQMLGRTSLDPSWGAIHEDGTPFPGESMPSTVALDTGREIRDVVMGIINPEKEDYSWIKVHAVPQFLPGERHPYQVYVTFEDVTELKKKEEALRASEERYRTLFEHAPVGIFTKDLQGRYLSSNDTIRIFTAVSPIGKTDYELQPREIAEQLRSNDQEVMETGELTIFDEKYMSPTGLRHLLAHKVPLRDGQGEIYGVLGATLDITERVQAERELEASQRRLQALFDNTLDAIMLADNKGRYVEANPAACQLTGYSREELLDLAIWDLTPAANLKATRETWSRFQATGELSGDIEIKRKDSRSAEVEFRAVANILPGLHLSVMHDISQRKYFEGELRNVNRFLGSILESISDGFFVLDESFKIIFFNQAAEEILGHKSSEVLGQNLWKVFPEARGSVFEENYRLAMQEKKALHFETYFQAEPYANWYEVRVYPFEDGISVYFQVTTGLKQNERALRESEERYRRLVEFSPEAISVVSRDRLVFTNRAGLEQYGAQDMEQLLNHPIEHLVHSEDRETTQQLLEQLQEGKPTPTIELRGRRLDGSYFPLEATAIPYTYQGEPAALVISRDVTERKKAKEELQRMEQRLRTVVDNAPIILFAYDREGMLVFSQGKGLEAVGDDPADYLGRSGYELMTAIPISLPSGETISGTEAVDRVLAGGTVNGRSQYNGRTFENYFVPMGAEDDSVSGLIGVSVDITERVEMERAEQEQRALAEALRDTAEALNSTLDFDEVLDRVLENISRVLPHDAADVLLLEGDTARIVRSKGNEAFGLNNEDLNQINLSLDKFASIRRAYESGQPNLIPDTREDPNWVDLPMFRWVRSYISAPIRRQEQVVGFLTLASSQPRFFEHQHAERLKAFADQAAVAIGNARIYQSLQQRTWELARSNRLIEALNRMAVRLQSSLEIEAMMGTLGRELKAIDLSWALAFYDSQARSLTIRHTSLKPEIVRRLERLTSLKLGELHIPQERFPHFELVKERGRAYFDENPDALGIAQAMLPMLPEPIVKQVLKLSRVYSEEPVAYLPLAVSEGVIGVMWIWGPEVQESDLPTFSIFANQVAVAVQNVRLFEDIRAGRERLRDLTQQIFTIQEDERQRLSRELHDEAGQAMTALKIGLELIHSDLPAEHPALRRRLDEAINLTETTMEQLRALAQDLRPPALDTVGLNATLQGYCQAFARRTNIKIDYRSAQEAGDNLPEEYDIALYRVLQEALNNAAKHAHAERVLVALEKHQGAIVLTVEDDGKGFDPDREDGVEGLGLLGMRERIELLGGVLLIDSKPRKGTRLAARLPLDRPHLERRKGDDSRRAR